MGHGTVADEIKGRAPYGTERLGRVISIEEKGVTFRSYIDGSEKFLGPETLDGGPGRARTPTSRSSSTSARPSTSSATTPPARRSGRTGGWIAACSGTPSNGPEGQLVYGIVQGGVYEDLRVESTQTIAAAAVDGIAIGGSLGDHKQQMYEVVDWTTAQLGGEHEPSLAICSGSATSTI